MQIRDELGVTAETPEKWEQQSSQTTFVTTQLASYSLL